MERADIVDVLQRALRQKTLPPDSAFFDNDAVAVDRAFIREAIAEIERFRSCCGS